MDPPNLQYHRLPGARGGYGGCRGRASHPGLLPGYRCGGVRVVASRVSPSRGSQARCPRNGAGHSGECLRNGPGHSAECPRNPHGCLMVSHRNPLGYLAVWCRFSCEPSPRPCPPRCWVTLSPRAWALHPGGALVAVDLQRRQGAAPQRLAPALHPQLGAVASCAPAASRSWCAASAPATSPPPTTPPAATAGGNGGIRGTGA